MKSIVTKPNVKKAFEKEKQIRKTLGYIPDDVVEEVKKIKKSSQIAERVTENLKKSNPTKSEIKEIVDYGLRLRSEIYWTGYTAGLLTLAVAFTLIVFIISQTHTADEIYGTIETLVDGHPYQPGNAVEIK